jgi:SNF2 family DNA or RNA helicase
MNKTPIATAIEFDPRQYQFRAISAMCAAPGYALFLDPGMGKTSSSLATCCLLKDAGEMTAAIVVAPIRPARNVWPAEVAKWEDFKDLRVSLVMGTPKQRIAALRVEADVYVINPEQIAWLAEVVAADRSLLRADVLFVDESTKFKNGQSKRFKALREMLSFFRRRYILTGTPSPQSMEDLWSQIFILDNGARLGRSLTAFRKRYFDEYPQRGGYSLWALREGADQEIFAKIADVCLRLDAKDHLDMPERIENKIIVNLSDDTMSQYRAFADDAVLAVAKGEITAANAAAVSMKLRQMANGAVYDAEGTVHEMDDAKLEALRDLIEEQSGQPLLVAVAFQHDADRIRKFLGDDTIPYLGGGMSNTYADRVIADWNAGKLPVVLAHPASVAHGLNLQSGGNAVCWFSLTWSLEDFIQFNARVWRQGQTSKTVVFHYLIAEGTIDSYVLDVLQGKDEKQVNLFNALKAFGRRPLRTPCC